MRRQRYELILDHPNFQRRKMISRTDPVILDPVILRQISAEYLEIKEAPPVGGASFMLVRHFNCLTGKVK